MGDWCSEELTPKLNETTAMVKMMITDKYSMRNVPFLTLGDVFSLDGAF